MTRLSSPTRVLTVAPLSLPFHYTNRLTPMFLWRSSSRFEQHEVKSRCQVRGISQLLGLVERF
jgi:hypothetical protein